MRRLAALTTASILALTLAPAAPALAAAGPDAQLREQARAAFDAPVSEASAAVDRRRHIIVDPAGDAREFRRGEIRRDTWRARLADLRRVSYTTPETDDGLITVSARWQQLRGARAQVAQRLFTVVYDPATERTWFLLATSRGRLQMLEFDESESQVRPEVFDLTTTPGADGEMTISMSTEWLDAPVVRFATFSAIGRASDDTNPTRRLQVGPRV